MHCGNFIFRLDWLLLSEPCQRLGASIVMLILMPPALMPPDRDGARSPMPVIASPGSDSLA